MKFHVGDRVALASAPAVSTGGCLVRFTDQPRRILLMGAAHGLVRRGAQPGDAVVGTALGRSIGRLQTWTTFGQVVTADLALTWVYPELVDESSASGVTPGKPGAPLRTGDRISIVGGVGGDGRKGDVALVDQDVPLPVTGPGWYLEQVVYAGQVLCEPMFTHAGDSGAVVLDEHGGMAGMVVAGRPLVDHGGNWVSQSVIVPAAAMLSHPDFEGRRLEVVSAMPGDAEPPP